MQVLRSVLHPVLVPLALTACSPPLTGPCDDCSASGTGTSTTSTTEPGTSTSTSAPTTGTSTASPTTGTSLGPGTSTGEPTTGAPDCAIHVELAGVDLDGCGPLDAPCRTITRGLAQATPGCPVLVGPGTFDAAGGEAFPLLLGDDVELAGAGADPLADPTVIDHAGGPPLPARDYPCPVGQPSSHSAPVLLAGDGPRLRDLIVRAPVGQTDEVAILIEQGSATVERVRVEGGAEGVFIAGDGTAATLTALTVTKAGHAAVKPAGTSQVTVSGSTFFANKDAVEPICDATTVISDSEAYCNGNGLEALADADTTMIGNYVHHNNVGIGGRGQNIHMTLRGNRIENNVIGALGWFGTIDAGTAEDAGNNVFKDNVVVGLEIIRVPVDTPAIGNTWQPNVDGADGGGLYAGAVDFAAPKCPSQGLMNLDVPPPPTCTGTEPTPPAMGYRNVALDDGTCFAQMPSPTGRVIVSVP